MVIGLGWFLTVATAASNVPQFHAIISRKSSYGLSFINLWIYIIQSSSNLLGAVLLQQSVVVCCYESWGWLDCVNHGLVIEQLFVNWVCMEITFVLYIIYHAPNPILDKDAKPREKRWVSILLFLIGLTFIIVICVTAFLLYSSQGVNGPDLLYMGDVLGIVGSIGMFLGNFPQIILTYRLKQVGSNSILMYTLQAPGVLLLAVFQTISAPDQIFIALS